MVGCKPPAVAGRGAVAEPSPCPVAPSASPPSAAESPNPSRLSEPAAPRREQALVEGFDCFSTLEEKRTESLRAWASGGPDGAAWNVDGAPLRCELRLRAPCAGAVTLRLLGNSKQLAKREAELAAGQNELDLRLPSPAWEKALEASPGPFSALLISISGFVSCSADSGGERLHFADAFLAGFSGGE